MDNQKIQLVLQALQMRDEISDPSVLGGRISKLTIDGENRALLIAELVKALTAPAVI